MCKLVEYLDIIVWWIFLYLFKLKDCVFDGFFMFKFIIIVDCIMICNFNEIIVYDKELKFELYIWDVLLILKFWVYYCCYKLNVWKIFYVFLKYVYVW